MTEFAIESFCMDVELHEMVKKENCDDFVLV